MDKPQLRVLIIEDSEDDAELMVRLIKKSGYSVYHERVETAQQMRETLKNNAWDIILSDYSMPNFTGINALEILKESGLDIPFILVSGTIGEETAVEMMRKGASDYILKSSLSRLVPVIEREIKECKIRANERKVISQLKESEAKYREMIELSPDSIVTVNLKGVVTSCNSAYEKFTGYSKEETIGKHFNKLPFLNIKDIPSYIIIFNDLLRNKKPTYLESSWINKDGSVHFGEIVIGILKRQDKIVEFQAITRDLTERKKTQEKLKESEEKYRELVENANSIISKSDKDGRIILMNEFGLKFFGYAKEELIGKLWIETVLPKVESTGRVLENLTSEIVNDINKYGINLNENIKKNGERVWIYWTNKPIYDKKRELEGYLSVGTDITDKKLAEEKLLESEEKFRLAFDNANTGMCLVDLNGNFMKINEKLCEILGYKKEELEGINTSNVTYPADKKTGPEFIKNAIDGKSKSVVFEKRYIHKDGHIVWGQVSSSLVSDVNGAPLYFITQVQDITDRKKAEEDLKESEERFRLFFEKANDPILLINENDDIIDVNEAASKVFGYTKEEFVSMKIPDLQAPEVRGLPGTVIKSEQKKYGDHPFEALDIDKQGRVFPVEVVASKIKFKGKDLSFNISRDISHRKKMEKEIELLYNAINQSPSIVVITDKKGTIEFVNPKFTEITGYSSPEVIGKNPRILKTGLLPKDRFATLWDSILSGKTWAGEFHNRKKDGTMYWESVSIAPVREPEGEITHFVKVAEDVTYKKLAEKKLQEREETLRGILSAAPIGISLMQNRAYKWTNRGMAEITGYSVEELIGKTPRVFHESDEEYERVANIIYKTPRERDVLEVETKIITKKGDIRDIYVRNSPLDTNDLSKGYIALVMDITESKKSKKQLQENLEYFAHLVDHIRNPLAIMSGFIQVEVEKEKTKERLMRQIDRIEELIKQLDQGWIDTEETRKFLKKYY